MKTLSVKRTALVLVPIAMLAACAGPADTSPAGMNRTPISVDGDGRVTRPRGERHQDDSMGRAVLTSLRQSDAAAFKGVSVLAWDKAVLLSGAVAKPEHRRRAEQLARAIEGVADVHNDLVLDENPGAPAFVPNVTQEQRIYAGLLGQKDVTGAYVVRMVNGVVTLLGTSRSAEDVNRAMAFAHDAEGVKWVVNRVAVRGQ